MYFVISDFANNTQKYPKNITIDFLNQFLRAVGLVLVNVFAQQGDYFLVTDFDIKRNLNYRH